MFLFNVLSVVSEESRLVQGTVKFYTNWANTYTNDVLSNGPMTKITDLYNQYKIPT
jgi:hypothetical protein